MDTKPKPSPGITWIIQNWRSGQRPDTRGVLDAHPEWSDSASVILNLALEEYCLRRDSGEQVPFSTFCDQFPTVRGQLRALLDVEQHLPGDEALWPEVGDDFLEFRLERQLGEGAVARVYLARQRTLGQRYVALKVSRFGASEAATLGKLQHPHVVPVFSVHFDEQQQLTAVCMPYLGAATLFDVCRAAFEEGRPQRAEVLLAAAANCPQVGEFVRAEAPAAAILHEGTYIEGIIHLMAELAEGLAYTHAHGVLHRDLKPSNVLVTPQGRPMLLDFNLSRDRDLELSRIGGTLPYMPPEQVYATFFMDAQPPGDDPRSDIYSLGVILYQMLANRLPFPAANPTRVEEVQRYLFAQTEGAEDVRKWNPDVPEPLALLVAECLELAVTNRPSTAAALAARLRAMLPAPEPLATAPPARSPRYGRWVAVLGTLLLAAASIAALRADLDRLNRPSASSSASSSDPPRDTEPTLDELLNEVERLCDERRYKDADTLVRQAQQLDPTRSFAEYSAYCAFRADDFKAAADLLRRAAEQTQDAQHRADLLNNLGYCLMKLHDVVASRELLEAAIQQSPRHYQALLNRALWNITAPPEQRDPDGGVQFLHAALDAATEDNFVAHFIAARVLAHALSSQKVQRDQLLSELEVHVRKCFALGVTRAELGLRHIHEHLAEEAWFQEGLASANDEAPPRPEAWRNYYVAPAGLPSP